MNTPLTAAGLGLAAALIASSAAPAQVFRASCDNRNGTTFADVVDGTDPNENGYNIDPSELFRTFNTAMFPAGQSSGGNSAAALLTVSSQFFGANPANRITGFRATVSGSVTLTRSNLTVRGQSQDRQSVCFDLSGASAAAPARWRLVGGINLQGGTTGQIRLTGPNGADIVNQAGATINRAFNFTQNGTYSLLATFDTTNFQISSGTGTQVRSAGMGISWVCSSDYNGSGDITVQDIFDFLGGYFTGSPSADVNGVGGVTVQDIFDFLSLYFGGCP
jgi:hypothetical protein